MVITTTGLRLEVGRAPFTLRLVERATGAILLRTADRLRQVAGLLTAPSVVVDQETTTLNLELGPDEDVLGFGEQFGRLVKNGQRLRLRSEDACGTGTGLAYKPVPVWHSSQGYTGFVNTGAVVTADVGHSMPSVLSLGLDDSAIDLYVFAGADPRARLTAYTALTGRATAPQPWAFGYWMGRCRYHTSEEMLEVGRSARAHGVPMDVLHLDPDWLVVDRLNTDFIWNTSRFGERKQFVDDLAELDLRLSVWELPYLDPASPIFEEAEREGYLVRRTDGSLAAIQKTPTPDGRMRALIDFTNPAAKRWWQQMHREFLDDGVAVFKTDFGEALPDDVALFDGTPANQAHNLYPLRYNGAVSEAIAEFTDRPPLVWGRSGWAGSHRYPGQWAGDAESTVVGMQATVRGGLSYAMSAPGFWSHDIGGFFGPELTPALYVRWTQLGALSPLMRAHGLRPREPWPSATTPSRSAGSGCACATRCCPTCGRWRSSPQPRAGRCCAPWACTTPRTAWPAVSTTASSSGATCSSCRSSTTAPRRRDARSTCPRASGSTCTTTPGMPARLPHRRRPAGAHAGAGARRRRHPTGRGRRDRPLRAGPSRSPWTLHAYGAAEAAVTTLVGFDSQPAVVGTRWCGMGADVRPPTDPGEERWIDLGEKLARLRDLARARDLDTLVLREPAALTWLLGARVNVPQTLDAACLDVVVHLGEAADDVDGASVRPGLTVVTNAIESPRLRDTELAGLGSACDLGWEVVPWWESRDGKLPTGPRVGSDRPLAGTVPVGVDLAALRRRLTPRQQHLLSEVSRDTAAAATAAALALSPAMTGYAAAGELARQLLERELDPIVLLVGGADHLDTHRHPLPLAEAVGERAMLVACGRRHGLVASVTRIVSFTPLDDEQRDAYARCCGSSRPSSTPPGSGRGSATSCRRAARHTAAGFRPRGVAPPPPGRPQRLPAARVPRTPSSDVGLGDGSVVAWNPSAVGWKVEDTTLVLPDGARTLVTDEHWPSLEVGVAADPTCSCADPDPQDPAHSLAPQADPPRRRSDHHAQPAHRRRLGGRRLRPRGHQPCQRVGCRPRRMVRPGGRTARRRRCRARLRRVVRPAGPAPVRHPARRRQTHRRARRHPGQPARP